MVITFLFYCFPKNILIKIEKSDLIYNLHYLSLANFNEEEKEHLF